MSGRTFGWVRPEAHGRAAHAGKRTALSLGGMAPAATLADLPPVFDQHRVGSCVTQALAGAVMALAPRSGYRMELPDRRALYRRARELIGTTQEDSGAIIADGIGVLRCGWEAEREEPPREWGPAWREPAPVQPLDAPRIVSAEALDFDPASIAWELACGHPVVVGLQVTEAWMGFSGTMLPPPREAGDVVGGHAVMLVGYDLAARVWRVRNSWGEGWAEGGYAWLPWEWTSLPWCGEVHAVRAIRRAMVTP